MLKLIQNAVRTRRYGDWLALPLRGFPRWHMRKWMIKAGAQEGLCGWCDNTVPLFYANTSIEIIADSTATINPFNGTCIACGRDPYEFHEDWIYRAEYQDGCMVIHYRNGSSRSGGPKHAPHDAFLPDDQPIAEWSR